MTPVQLRTLAKAHGALAWASVAALVVALVLVWSGRRALAGWAVPVAAALGVATFVTGVGLHGPFQGRLRQRLFLASETLGWLFERKEHAAFGALALTLSALFATWAERAVRGGAGGAAGGEGAAVMLTRAAALGLAAALVLSVLSLGVSVAVAGRVGF